MANEKRLIRLDMACGMLDRFFCNAPTHAEKSAILEVKQALLEMDAVEVVHGRWFYDGGEMTYFCSKCGKGAIRHRTTFLDTSTLVEDCLSNYCPNCGAKMDGDRNG